jgi:hypothetical protein
MDRTRGAHSPYCLPSQMTVPIALKWLLVYEDPVSGVVTLGRGIPRDRLAHGLSIKVDRAPTRRGEVSYAIQSRIDDGAIDAVLTLPQRNGKPFRLRLRAPEGNILAAVKAVRPEEVALAIEGDCIVFPADLSGRVELTTNWTRAS